MLFISTSETIIAVREDKIIMNRAYVIYDTSWLMYPRVLWTFDYLPAWVALRLIIPDEVKREIEKHFDNLDKEQVAKRARKNCAKLMSIEGYMEFEAKDIPHCPFSMRLLGADSKTDRKLIDLAWYLVDKDKECFVYVATLDGGVQAELAILFSQHKLPIFCPANIDQFRKYIGCPSYCLANRQI
jgi:hypothetical protein